MTKFKASYPLKNGDECTRYYASLSIAKREVVKHLKACQSPQWLIGRVWQVDGLFQKLVFESDTNEVHITISRP